ncbi:MAG: hypothetical protein N2169_07575 [bacterium]|nr:hypothetical protein [bacterium]
MRIMYFINKYPACLSTALFIVIGTFAIVISAKTYAASNSPGCDCVYESCPRANPPDYQKMCSPKGYSCYCLTPEYTFCFNDKKGKCIGLTSGGCGGTRPCEESDCNKDMNNSGCGSEPFGCPPKKCGMCARYTGKEETPCPGGHPVKNGCQVKCDYTVTYEEME